MLVCLHLQEARPAHPGITRRLSTIESLHKHPQQQAAVPAQQHERAAAAGSQQLQQQQQQQSQQAAATQQPAAAPVVKRVGFSLQGSTSDMEATPVSHQQQQQPGGFTGVSRRKQEQLQRDEQ